MIGATEEIHQGMGARAVPLNVHELPWGALSLVAKLCPVLVTPWTVAHQAPPSIGFPRQEYYSGLLFPSSGDLPHPGLKPVSPTLACRFFTTESPGKPAEKLLGRLAKLKIARPAFQSSWSRLAVSLVICLSNKLLAEADSAGLKPHLRITGVGVRETSPGMHASDPRRDG